MAELYVYDKAKYHYQGDFPAGLPHDQAFVHTGMYLGWIVERGLYSAFFAEEGAEMIAAFRARQMTGANIYDAWDGCLTSAMLNDEGNAFSLAYFDFEKGHYLADYGQYLAAGYPSVYHVPDTWQNYDRLRPRIDERYAAWKREQAPRRRWWRWFR